MRVLLIAPNHRKILSPSYMQAVQEGVGHLPPLGLMSLAAYLEKKGNYRVKVLDALLEDLSPGDLEAELKLNEYNVVGIHTITLALQDVLDTSRIVGAINPQAKIVMGGPHTSIFPEESMAFPEFDYVVLGEGEEPFYRLVRYIETGDRSLLPVDGVMGREEELSRIAAPFIHPDLDLLPFPRRDLTPYRKYASVVSRHPPSTTLMGSRGCPFDCAFCYTAGGKKYRARSVEHILEEVRHCLELGIDEFFFFDETFTIDRKRVIEFCRRVVEGKMKIFFDVRARVDLVDEEMLGWMKKAGCSRIQYGVESGSRRVLERLRKGFTPERAEKAFEITRRVGIDAYADFMIGNPGETREEINQTLNFALKINPDYVHYSITMPLPKTELYREALERGIIKEDYWKEFAKNPTSDFKIHYWEENFTAQELEEILRKAYRSFYFRPGYMLKSLGKLGSLGELKRKIRAGLNLFKMG